MLMVTKKCYLFFFVIMLNLTALSISEDIIFHACDDNTDFTINNTFERNLEDALSSLTSNTSITYGFYTQSVGQNPNQVNVIGLCRGDVKPNVCRVCINQAGTELKELCPNQKGAIGWYDKCMLRYSNVNILEVEPDTSHKRWSSTNPNNASNVDQFNQARDQLLAQLTSEASSGGTLRKYASNSTDGPGATRISAFEQCTPDLSENQCKNCLDDAIQFIPSGVRGGGVYYPSCIIRYEDYRFFEDTVVLEPPSPQPTQSPPSPRSSPSPPPPAGKSSNIAIIVVIATVGTIILVILVVIFVCVFTRRKRKQERRLLENSDEDIEKIGTIESLQHSFGIIRDATNDFSENNKLGQGGFGEVYKGKLQDGEEIAVKRLSRGSGQGEQEFKNEVLLLHRLQHRNLVRLKGFSLEGSERLLIYEFVQNGSLDQFIFDPTKSEALDWKKRFKIIFGIAKGLLYLHEDSRLKIIHRDMKASNVLLDAQMNPKIADFGIARLFLPEETQGNTSRIIGTPGYMAPEYVSDGHISVKTDVFSFGVLLLEIVTGKKNDGKTKDLLSHAWKSWRDGKVSNLIDESLGDGSNSPCDMSSCIRIGLLCVQEDLSNRPTMASIVLMLSGVSSTLPVPSEPAFFKGTNTNSEKELSQEYYSSTGDPNHLESK